MGTCHKKETSLKAGTTGEISGHELRKLLREGTLRMTLTDNSAEAEGRGGQPPARARGGAWDVGHEMRRKGAGEAQAPKPGWGRHSPVARSGIQRGTQTVRRGHAQISKPRSVNLFLTKKDSLVDV